MHVSCEGSPAWPNFKAYKSVIQRPMAGLESTTFEESGLALQIITTCQMISFHN